MSSGFQPPSKSFSPSSIISLASDKPPARSTSPVLPKYPYPLQLLDESWNVHAYILEIKEEIAVVSRTMAHVEFRLTNTDESHPNHAYLQAVLDDLHLSLMDLEAKRSRWTAQLKVVMEQRKAIQAEA